MTTPDHPGSEARTVEAALRRPLSRTAVRLVALALLAGSLLAAHLSPPHSAQGTELLRLMQTMTLLALILIAVDARRRGRPAQAAVLAIPVLGTLIAGTIGADTLMNGVVTVLILKPSTCAAVLVTAGLMVLAALLAETISDD